MSVWVYAMCNSPPHPKISNEPSHYTIMSRDMTKPKHECAPSEDSDQPGQARTVTLLVLSCHGSIRF